MKLQIGKCLVKKKERNIKIIKKKKKMKTLIFVFSLLYFAFVQAKKNIWIGEWVASDQWQSEFLISINNDGTASSNYGSGETGSWKFTGKSKNNMGFWKD